MSKVITSPATNIPLHEKSHVLGWSLTWADLIGAEVNNRCTEEIANFDRVYLDHGVNWGGSLNLFAGVTEEVVDRFERLMEVSPSNVVSLDWEMPEYGEFLRKRIKAKSTSPRVTEDWCDRLSDWCTEVKHIKMDDVPHRWLAWGDSHTPAFARQGSAVLKKDGRTMYGVIKNGTLDELTVKPEVEGLTLVLGSIDVRHHLCREESISVADLCEQYMNVALKTRDRLGVEIEIAAPVPIEFEDRKIPKTGFFKNTPFYGTRIERMEKTLEIMSRMRGYGFTIVAPPGERYTMDGEEYAKTYMELGGSVHMAPPYYRRNDLSWTTL